ncbi:MAG TPA: translocation/assembly module TamB domain-containing protein, partial [Candidatus Limnocylindrales bacterium]|nr:translocation/assembly module TamB domain-containing protein [Candidatus Limnocylindrales bacterium]
MSTLVAAPPKKKRRLRRWTLIAAGVLLLVFGALLIYMSSDGFRESVRQRLVAEIQRATGGKVELQSFTWTLSSLEFEVRGLTVHGLEAPGQAPYAHADRIVVNVKILSFLTRKISLSNVAVDRLAVHLIVYPNGSTNQPSPQSAKDGAGTPTERFFDLEIKRLQISSGTLILNEQQIPFAFTAERVAAGMTYSPKEQGYETGISMSLLSARWREYAPERAEIDATLLLRHADADIKSLKITSQRSSLIANGTLRNYNNPQLVFQYSASMELPEIAKLARLPQLKAGHADLKGNLSYQGSSYSAQGNLSTVRLDWKEHDWQLTDAEIKTAYSINPEKIQLSHITARLLGGSAQGDLQVSNWASPEPGKKPARKQQGTANFQISRLGLTEIASALVNPGLPLRKFQAVGNATGSIKGNWTGSPQNAVAGISLDVDPPAAVTPHEIPVTAQLRATYHGDTSIIDVAALNLATRAIRVNATGRLGSESAQAKLSVNSTDLHELRPVLAAMSPGTRIPVLLEGRASFNGSLSGRLSAITTRGRLELENFDSELAPLEIAVPPSSHGAGGAQRIHWDSLIADLVYSPSTISMQNGVLRRGKAQMNFSVSASLRNWVFDDRSSQVNLSLRVQDTNVEEVQALAGLKYPLTGIITADVRASGTPQDLRGNGNLQLNKLTAYGEPFNSFHSQFQFAGKQFQFNNLVLTHNSAQLTGNYGYNFAAGNFQFDLTGSNIDLASMHIFESARLTVEGKGAFHLLGSGTAAAPAVTGRLDLRDVVLNHELVGNMTVTGETTGSDLVLQGRSNFKDASLNVDGKIQLRGDWPGQMTLRFAQLDFDPLIRAYFSGEITGHSAIAGTIDIHGPFRRPRDLVISGTADQLTAELQNIRLVNDGPVHFSMDSEFARLDQFHMIGENTDMFVQGGVQVAAAHDLDLRTRGRLDLKLLQGYNHDILAYGPANFTIDIRGDIAHPQLSGRFDLVDASISLADLPNGLSHINGNFNFVQNRVQIEKLTAQSGGGTLNVGGFLAWRNGIYFDLTATSSDVRLRYPPGVSASANANLRYTGSAKSSQLSGDVLVTRLGVNPRFDFANYLAQSRTAPGVATLNPFLDNLRLDVHVTSTPELRVETSLAKVSGDVDLRIRGTAARPA